ncbi:Os07g0185401 [Oryza sativa Japonica Group]|uniref:Os07g0185401 protein n=2 Tax=Oryza sativa subsp. japonica TaxID=39947 RepID=B9FVW3_ORYSJ|nr:hypothetical protein OsJ_23364 [Oryza sativa Japonica Group]BAT00367.1 Os07g0185401 [Oryza sativa Japonica Group]
MPSPTRSRNGEQQQAPGCLDPVRRQQQEHAPAADGRSAASAVAATRDDSSWASLPEDLVSHHLPARPCRRRASCAGFVSFFNLSTGGAIARVRLSHLPRPLRDL